MNDKLAILLSGGLDSAVLLAREIDAGRKPHCYTFHYGQRHAREVDSATRLAFHYRCPHTVIPILPGTLAGSALTGQGEIPHVHYADPAQSATVVPNRNAVLLSLAAACATTLGLDRILFAVHAGDAAIYPDCRASFVAAIDAALRFGCGVGVEAPFLALDKRRIVALGRALDVPLEMTWSCYEGGEVPCAACGACRERSEAGA